MTTQPRTRLDRVRASVGIATENAGLQAYYATRALDPQGESA